jgi:hypothetical protein
MGFQVTIEPPAKSRLRDHFSVAWIMSQLARAESQSWLRLSEQNLRIDKWSVCQG